jgi:CubicO group peptidase (beta-lactamase class C family)/peptidoglycan/LPS O-acetylase OafA/YrhL
MIPTTSLESDPPRQARRDGFLDAVKAIALWRVVVWHALAWPWLSWFAAMPAMFYVAGVLLQQSLDRHGYPATLRARLSRMLVPFWVFGLVAGAVMALSGWRPRLVEIAWWMVPIGDPVGADSMPGFWVPLWYLRAYLWVLVAGAGLAWLCRRFGVRVLLGPAVATLGVWGWQSAGNDVPLFVADAALFPFFVMAGMLTALGSLDLQPRRAVPLGLGALVLAVAWYVVDDVPMGIVHSSLPVHLLAGVATLALLVGVRRPLAAPGAVPKRFIDWSSSRALTIYLWHGLGLVVADRIVHRHDLLSPVGSLAGVVVVVLVTLAATVVVGGIEDRTARRAVRPAPAGLRHSLVPAAILVAAALISGDVGVERARIVPSGEAVLARAERAEVVEGDLSDLGRSTAESGVLDEERLDQAMADWVEAHQGLLDDLGTDLIEVALVDSGGSEMVVQWTRSGDDVGLEPFAWWSMTKTMTAAWMMQLAAEGVIDLDQPLSTHLSDVPNAERITFEQLAGHRAGLPETLDHDFLDSNPAEELRTYRANPTLAYEPGEGYQYSRIGYHLLTWGLEEASGSSWQEAMRAMADEAGATLLLDEELSPSGEVTHPGHGDYRGTLWGAGGLNGTTLDGARLYRWTLVEALDEEAVRRMATADTESFDHYGLGLTPNCPCVSDGDHLSSDRVGLSTLTGIYVVDLSTEVGLMLRTDNWWSESGPALEFDDLIMSLLDTVDSPGLP